jgi:hypothetical protein
MERDVSLQALAKFFRGSPPEEPERFYRLTREGNWLRGTRAATSLEVSAKKIVSHARVRYRAVFSTAR